MQWQKIDKLDQDQITYFLYKQGLTVSQIAIVRNLSKDIVNQHLIKAKMNLKLNKPLEIKSILQCLLEVTKDKRKEALKNMNNDQLNELKKELSFRIKNKKENEQDILLMIWICGEINWRESLDLISNFTIHPNGNYRRASISAIGKLESDKALNYIHKAMVDPKPQVRQYAAKALCKIGNLQSLKKINNLKFKKDEKDYVQRALLEAEKIIKEKYKIE